MSRAELCWECGQPYESSPTDRCKTMCPACYEMRRIPDYLKQDAEMRVESVDLNICETLTS